MVAARLTAALTASLPRLTAAGAAAALFALFLLFQGHNPLGVFADMFVGGFGSEFSWQNTLVRAAPLMLTALCTLIPARLGLVIIGGEGAWLLGGLAAAVTGWLLPPGFGAFGLLVCLLAGAVVGGLWIGLAGAGRQLRGVDPTISSLLLYYAGWGLFLFLVEGPLRDPLSLNKPSTWPMGAEYHLGTLFGTGWPVALVPGVLACVGLWWLLFRTRLGFDARITGGNERVASRLGLARNWLVIGACVAGGAAAGLAGGMEVASVHHAANASLNAGLGFAGILVAFLARQNPLAVPFFALLIGGIQASGGLIQRHTGLPDATLGVFQGLLFLAVLLAEAFQKEAKGAVR